MTASSSMYLDSNLRIEIISSLLGQTIKPYDKKSRGTAEDILSVDEFHLHNLTGKRQAYLKQPIIKEEDFFDPDYDCDFTNLSDTSADCKRGDELYERPKGWYRMALKVTGKYPDGDTWLGTKGWRNHSVPGEWPVSYHGTSLKGAKGIIRSHYSAGNGDLYGRGIYSTPDVHVAEREEYAKTFTSKTTGKSYKVILQNRINPKMREICPRFDYWLVPVRKEASADEERKIVDSSIRPYGILIKELNDGDDSDEVYGGSSGQDDGYEVSDDYYSDSYDRHDDGSVSDSDDEDDDTGDGDEDGDEDDDTGDGDDDGDEDDDTGDGDDEDANEDYDGDDGDGDGDGDESDGDGTVQDNSDDNDSGDNDGDDGDGDGDSDESDGDGTVQDNSDDNDGGDDGGDDDGDDDEDFDDDGSYNDGKHDADYSEDTCNDDGDNDDYDDDFDDVSGSYDDDDDWS